MRLVTVLFADVVGSTARAEKMHPEDIHNHMSSYFEAMSQEIVAEGGAVERLLGDAVLALFGIPVAHEDDPLRAVRAARHMLARLESWNADKDPDLRLEIRIGINTGEVLVRGAPGQELLVSDAVNVAARLQHEAERGSIVVGGRTARAIERHFDLKALPPLALKGKSGLIAAWSVEHERQDPPVFGSRASDVPLVGRDREIEQITAHFQTCISHNAPFRATISGEAGIGKTRLAREFLLWVEDRARIVVGRCIPYGEGVTLWPLVEILRSEAQIVDTDPSEVAIARLHALAEHRLLQVFMPQIDRIVGGLAATLGIRTEDARDLDPTETFEEILHAWRVLLSSMSAQAPVVFFVDDLHWADDTMLEVIDDLIQNAQGPAFFLCSARPDLMQRRPRWGIRFQNEGVVPLHPLKELESAQLVDELLGQQKAPVGLHAALLGKSEGNPFFLEEIVRKLIDEGSLTQHEGGWALTSAPDEIELPDNVQAVIAARLDLLDPQAQTVVQKAAVLGRSFWKGAIESISGLGSLDPILQTLQSKDFVTRRLASAMGDEIEFAFTHALIRDVAYERLPRRTRAATHMAFAEWLEERLGDRPGEAAELLAYHYGRAFEYVGGDPLRVKARDYCLASSRNALERFAISQAEAFGRRAVELSTAGLDRVAALEALGDVCYLTYKIDQAWQAYRDALQELERHWPVEEGVVAHIAAKASMVPTRWQGSMHRVPPKEEVDRVLATGFAVANDGDSSDISRLLTSRAFYQIMGYEAMDETGEQAAQEAVEFAEKLGDADLISSALDAVSGWLLPEGAYGDLDEIHRRRLQLVDRLTDPKEICDVFAMAAYSSFHMGHYGRAVDHATSCIERARRIDAGGYLHGLVWRVCARFMAGDWAGALEDQAEIERLSLEDQRDEPVPFAMRAYGTALLCKALRGEDPSDDLRVLRHFHSQSDAAGNHPGSRAIWARYLAHTGDFKEARLLIKLSRSHVVGIHMEAFCEVLRLQEDWERAEEFIPQARAEAERARLISLPGFIDRLAAGVAQANGDMEHAANLLTDSIDAFGTLGAPWEKALSQILLAETIVATDRVAAIKLASEAAATFSRLRSEREVARAERLLASAGGTPHIAAS